MAAKVAPLVFTYNFRFPDRTRTRVDVTLDPDSLRVIQPPPNPAPEWSRLEYRQCPNCPLKAGDTPLCPVAANLAGVVSKFGDSVSFKRVEVRVTSGQRQVQKSTSVAEALTSLIGIYMAASGCPVLDHLRPMLLTHLPFATGIETFYRSLSTYLLGQHFAQQQGKAADWSFSGLGKLSTAIQTVNQAFCMRLRGLGLADGVLNAVSHLDCFAMLIGAHLRNKQLGKIERLFSAYLGDAKTP